MLAQAHAPSMTGRSGHERCACLKLAFLPLPNMQQLTQLQLDLALVPLDGRHKGRLRSSLAGGGVKQHPA